jgi:hypothetical protein
VRGSAILPENLYLVIHRDQQAYRAKVVWRNGSQAGLTFIDAIDLTSALPLNLSYLKRAAQSGDCLSWG